METCKNCLHYDICTFHVTGNENEKCTHYTPAADVVPKSEVVLASSDAMKMLIECHGYALTHDADIKKEVAREIFEEIDNILYRFAYPSLTAIGTINVINAEGYHLHTRDYAELKKKYTEGDNEES